MGQQQQQIDESGQCALHPGIQLHHQKKNGEWRILLHACPLCVSGLPATGQPISTPASRAASRALALAAKKEEEKSKKKKKKQKNKSPRQWHDDEGGEEDGDEGGEDAIANNQRSSEHHQRMSSSSSSSPTIDEIIMDNNKQQEVVPTKQKSKQRRSNRESHSKSPLLFAGSRPRSPSPQSPRRKEVDDDDDDDDGENDNATISGNHLPQTTATVSGNHLSQGAYDAVAEYNDFLQFLKKDAIEQHQQQQQTPRAVDNVAHHHHPQQQPQGGRKQDQHGRVAGVGVMHQHHQQAIIMDRSNRSDYSAANTIDDSNRSETSGDVTVYRSEYSGSDTVDYSAADTVSQAASEATYFSEDGETVSDVEGGESMGKGGVYHRQQQRMEPPRQEQQQWMMQPQLLPTTAAPHNSPNVNQVVHHQQQASPSSPMRQRTTPPPRHQSVPKSRSASPYNHRPPPPPNKPEFPEASNVPNRRPDPEDANEFNQMNHNHRSNNNNIPKYQHQQYQAHSPTPPMRPPNTRRGYPVLQQQHQPPPQQQQQLQHQPQLYPAPPHQQQQPLMDDSNDTDNNITPHELALIPHNDSSALIPHNDSSSSSSDTPKQQPMPKYLEQDEVSNISMSSVTRNMHKLQAQKKAAQQLQKENNRIEGNDSDSSQDESGTPRNGGESSHISSNNSLNQEINTGEFDERGYCKRHPIVRLRKKKFMRGWKVLLSNCPECCLEEMRRVKASRNEVRKKSRESKKKKSSRKGTEGDSRSGNKSRSSKSKEGSSKSRDSKNSKSRSSKESRSKKKKSSKNPPISQVNLRSAASTGSGNDTDRGGAEEYDDSRSIGTASTITISSYTHSTGGKWQNYANDGQSSVGSRSAVSGGSGGSARSAGSGKKDGKASKAARVTRMPYTDTYGEHGWYTGQVDGTTGTPHGMGTMNYGNGAVYEGEWRDGVSATPSKTREEPLLSGSSGVMSGGVGGISSRNSMPRPYGYRPQTTPMRRIPSFSGGRSYLATLNEDGSSSDYEYASSASSRSRSRSMSVPRSHSASPPTMPPLERTVVCGMLWTDVNGTSGAYTGEVNGLNIPDGMGSMRYDHGFVTEGSWRDGEMSGMDDDDDADDFSTEEEEEEEEGNDVRSIGAGSFQGYGSASMGGGGGYHPPPSRNSSSGAASVH